STGFFVLTRTTAEGSVKKLSMVPKLMEEQSGALVVESIGSNSDELGQLKGIKGTFTAIITPYSIFETYEQIREAVKWHLPRKEDLMYRLEIGGKRAWAPPLVDKINVAEENGKIEAHID